MNNLVDRKLNERQKRFCDYYVISLNATDAAIKAGYSENTANVIGSENLSKPYIFNYIQQKLIKREDKLEITAERVLKELSRIAFLDVRKLFDENGKLKNIVDLDDDTAAAIAGMDISILTAKKGAEVTIEELTKKIKSIDKNKALELLGRNLSIWHDKLEVKNTNLNINVNYDFSKLSTEELAQFSNLMKKLRPVEVGESVQKV